MKFSTFWTVFFHVNRVKIGWARKAVFYVIFLLSPYVHGQILFSEECFTGGVLTGGADTFGAITGIECEIDWQAGYTIRRAFAATYRYGRPAPFAQIVNGAELWWDLSSQAGPEQIETNKLSQYFAPHVMEITDLLTINGNQLSIDLPVQPYAGNMGWWGVYIIVLYESPNITTDLCVRHYTADQSQLAAQNYSISTPDYNPSFPVLFGIHAGRLTDWFPDRTRISINNTTLGEIWEPDLLQPTPSSGVQAHFSYRNGEVLAFNGDTANTELNRHDGTAIINDYISQAFFNQGIIFQRAIPSPTGGANPHPSFVIAYTPSCPLAADDMPRSLTYCRNNTSPETRQLQAIPGYDNYRWSPGHLLSDSTIANPICFADSSRWYRVRMWNDDGDICPQTIPVFVEVGQTPRPDPLQVGRSTCPSPTGTITFVNTAGKAPFSYTVGSTTQPDITFRFLLPGAHDVSVTDALGCTWDSTVTVPLNAPVEANFTANPTTGDTPLDVYFSNQSSPSATSFEWLLNGTPFSTSENTSYTFSDSGTYVVSLVAFYQDVACSDTASFTIRVDQGIELIVPNIFTPNGDGRNDQLVAQVRGVERLSWEVYNRWGNLLHSGAASGNTENIELWNGDEVPSGVYSVILTATGINGRTKRMDVAVTVVR